jgi:hypothetical protein
MEKTVAMLHNEHKEWLNILSFYKDDLKVFKNRLVETAHKNTSNEYNKGLEHFQNQIIIQQEQIDLLKHAIKLHEKAIGKLTEDNPVASEQHKLHDHAPYREKIRQFEILFASFRIEIMQFLAKWM